MSLDEKSIDDLRLHLKRVKNSLVRGEKDGDSITQGLTAARIPLAQIKDDAEFVNVRQRLEPEKIELLKNSIERDGLKTPIVVRASDAEIDEETVFWIRAGFRRLSIVRELGWENIPAIIIPYDAPDLDDYWVNLAENCQREKVTAFEIATQAKILRVRHSVEFKEIAQRVGVSADTLRDWVRFIELLPDDILEAWKNDHPYLNHRILSQFSNMTPWNASQAWRKMLGQMPQDPSMLPFAKRRKPRKIRVASFEKMQTLHECIGVATKLTESERKIALRCVEICMGAPHQIPGIWPRKTKVKIMGKKYFPDLALPNAEPDGNIPMPSNSDGSSAFSIDEEDAPMQNATSKDDVRSSARAYQKLRKRN